MNVLLKRSAENTKDHLGQEEREEAALREKRAILPAFDPEASEPAGVYSVESFFPHDDKKAVDYKAVWEAVKSELVTNKQYRQYGDLCIKSLQDLRSATVRSSK